MKRRIFGFLIMLAMLMSLFAFSASAEGGLTLTVSNEVAAPGSTVDVTIELTNNPGLVGLQFDVTYDENVLTLLNIDFDNEKFGQDLPEDEDAVYPEDGGITSYKTGVGKQFVSMMSALDPKTANGVFATLTFSVAPNATIGSSSAIQIVCGEESALVPVEGNLSEYQYVPVNGVGGSVIVGAVVSGTISGVAADTESTVYLYKKGTSETEYTTKVIGNVPYSFVVLPAEYDIKVVAEGYISHRDSVDARSKNVTHDVPLELIKYTISGTVSGLASGAEATIYLYKGNDIVTQKTMSNGDYSFKVLPGTYRIEVAAAGYNPYSVDGINATTGNATHNVVLILTTYTVNGTVTGPDGAVAGATVSLWMGETKVTDDVTTAANGTYTFSGVVPATYTIKVTADGYNDRSETIIVSANVSNYSVTLTKPVALGTTVSGTVTSFNSETDNVTVELYAAGASTPTYSATVTGNSAAYTISGVAAGTYTMKVSKNNHVTREYTVTVSGDPVVQDAKIHLLGDVTGDGRVRSNDITLVYNHVNGSQVITDSYIFACADITGEGRIRSNDIQRIYNHVNKSDLLW